MSDPSVVYVHGMWMPGEEMLFVKHHLETKHGFTGGLFRYPSVRGTLDENAELLAEFVAEQEAAEVHIIGHSLGGVLALRMFAINPDAKPGRVVCLGSPLSGSRAADILKKTDWGSAILGKTIGDSALREAENDWTGTVMTDRDVGCIAGTTPVGLGRLVANFKEPNDGTVAVAETQAPGLTDHICMPHSHSTMVVSGEVADQAAAFLNNGKFMRND